MSEAKRRRGIQLRAAVKRLEKVAARHWVFILACLTFTAVGVFVSFSWYRYQINPDATSYFSIAEKYAHGDIRHAVNGYWGPMLSWLLIPAVWLGGSLIVAAKIIMTLAAVAILVTVYIFLLSRGASRLVSTLASLLLAGLLLETVAVVVAPDILMAFFTLIFALILISFSRAPSLGKSILLALSGALMYFTKGIGFYVFLAAVVIIFCWDWLAAKNIKLRLGHYALAVVVFLALTLPFIAAISLKYHKPTINNAGSFDHALFGPASKGQYYPMQLFGPLAPPNKTAVSIWEDPTYMIKLIPDNGWNPLASRSNLRYFASSIIGANLNSTIDIILSFGPLVFIGLVLLVIGPLQKVYRREYTLFLLVALMLTGAYSLVYVNPRYLLALAALGVIGLGLWLSLALKNSKFLSTTQIAIAGILVVGVALLTSGQKISAGRYTNMANYKLSSSVNSYIPAGANIISDDFLSYQICYLSDLHCFSVLAPPVAGQTAYYQELKKFNISYYVAYHAHDNPIYNSFIDQYFHKVGQPAVGKSSVTIYQLD